MTLNERLRWIGTAVIVRRLVYRHTLLADTMPIVTAGLAYWQDFVARALGETEF